MPGLVPQQCARRQQDWVLGSEGFRFGAQRRTPAWLCWGWQDPRALCCRHARDRDASLTGRAGNHARCRAGVLT